MPVFTFHCTQCNIEFKRLLKKSEDVPCKGACNYMLSPLLPTSVTTQTMEKKDPYRGVSLPKGHKKSMTKRMNQHHDKYEAEQKIDEFGVDDAKRLGWDKKVRRI